VVAGSYTTSTAFLEALAQAGVRYVFANLGSDHPGLIEALAQARAEDRESDLPRLILCPHESVALSAAHAYASVSRQPQAVFVHVDVGTQNLGGAVSNAMRGRVPVLIFAGAAPFTLSGELPAGRNEFVHWIQDVPDQRKLAELLAIPVLESAAFHVNFPGNHPLHAGYQFTTPEQSPVLARADVILVLDSDVPWIPAASRPSPGTTIYAVDVDPLKTAMSMSQVPARRIAAADSKVAVEQIARFVRENIRIDTDAVEARRAEAVAASQARRASLDALEQPDPDVISPRYLTGCVRELLGGTDPLVLTEAITNYQVVAEHLRISRPGSLLGSGGSSLGWAGGGAVGAKLACPERTVVCLVGDGSYLFGVPSSVQWVARRYGTPALTIIYDNRGWAAPKFSALQVHPDGAAARTGDFHVSFDPEADLPGVARAAGGAYGVTVADPGELPGVLKDALAVVHGGRSAVVSVQLPPV
jgi:acetolactate synthase-1/2/3 large subunit